MSISARLPLMFSKSLESALAAAASLAEHYDGGQTTLTAGQIAEDRGLNRPFVAKLLTALTQAELVTSKPGRNGGFCLSRPPDQVTLLQVADAVGFRTRIHCCPFGPDYGEESGRHCPMHEKIAALRSQAEALLAESTLAGFDGRRQ